NKKTNVKSETNKIIDIAKQNNLNIFRVYFNPDNNTESINIYAAIGNPKSFLKEFKLSNKTKLLEVNDTQPIASTNNKEASHIDLMSSDPISIFNITNNTQIPLTGTYYISGPLPSNINKDFISIGLTPSINPNIKNNITNSYNINSLATLLLILGLIYITYIHYLLNTGKEYSIKVTNGYSKKDILITYYNFILKTNLFSVLSISALIAMYSLFVYNGGLINFLLNYFSVIIPIGLFIIVSLALLSLIIFKFNIALSLKNKKSFKLIQKVNLCFKFLSLLIIIILFARLFFMFDIKLDSLKNMSYWKNTNKYSYTVISMESPNNIHKLAAFYNQTQNFAQQVNDSSFLIAPNYSLISPVNFDTNTSPLAKTSLNDGNVIFVNSNYLKKNPIYSVNNTKIISPSNLGDNLIVLVPKMYEKYKTELINSYTKWYQWNKYANDYMLQRSSGDIYAMKPSQYPPVNVSIEFIKNNQKTLLYNIKNPYSINSCIVLVNGYNLGADSYGSFLERGDYYIPNQFNNQLIEKAALKSNLSTHILETPTLYSKMSGHLFSVKEQIKMNIFDMFLLISIQIIITIFYILNYIEQYKMEFSIKIINGFGFFDINKYSLLKSFGLYVVTYLIFFFFYGQTPLVSGIITFSIMLLELILFTFLFKFKIRKLLNNLLNKE
ncbi:MAG: hypothetical protein ACRCYE_04730, partial [Sarcina sp.]